MIEVKLRFNAPPAESDLSQLLSVARQVDQRNCATWSNDGKQWTLLIHTKSRVEGKEAIETFHMIKELPSLFLASLVMMQNPTKKK